MGLDRSVTTFQNPPAVPLDSSRIALRQLSLAWLDEVESMVNYEPFSALTATTKKFSKDELAAWLTSRPNQTDRCDWAILDVESGEFAGEIVLNELNREKNSMNLRICLANDSWVNQGIGSEAINLVLTYAFDGLKLAKVTLEVLVTNPRAIRAYQKLGFAEGRKFSEGKFRFQRMSIDKLQFIQAMCEREMTRLLPAQWKFAFDAGKRRAGLCNYTEQQISLSKHLVMLHDVDQARQVLWHEIAHALCGKVEGHGKRWLATAKQLGYRAEKFSGNTIAENTAPWVGSCPSGHLHYRYRKPTRLFSCAKCSRGFDQAALITWRKA